MKDFPFPVLEGCSLPSNGLFPFIGKDSEE